jgi:hypothetical protein
LAPLGHGVVSGVHAATGFPTQDSQIFLLHRQVPKSGRAQQFGKLVVGWQERSGPF